MEIKLFGRKVFEFNKSSAFVYNATESLSKSKYLPDFYTMREGSNTSSGAVLSLAPDTTLSLNGQVLKTTKVKEKIKPTKSPKEVYDLKMLHDNKFTINTQKEYVETQIQQFKDKLNIIKSNEYDISRGTNEIASVLIRLENRKKYSEQKSFFEEFAYTTTTKINEVVKNHDNLKIDLVGQFVADMPKEAVEVMKDYTNATEKLCEKKPIFYIIADKKDFQKSDKRRDPILLVQSPFAHAWQILGAWDKEMMFLEEL